MLAATVTSLARSADQLLLRWSDAPELPAREEPVEMIGLHSAKSVIRSGLMVSELTHVHLIGKNYTGNGIIQSCRKEGNSYILTILMTTELALPELPERDPGVFAVDDFLTEEEETKILESLCSGIPRQTGCIFRQLSLSFRRFFSNSIQMLRSTLKIQNLLVSA